MKRLLLVSSVVPTVLIGLTTAAQAEPRPMTIYVPTEAVTLRPLSVNGCSSQENAGTGCANVTEETEIAPYAGDLTELLTQLETSLQAYDINIISGGADARPPEWVPFSMFLPSDVVSETGTNFTCTGAAINCGALKRNFIFSTNGGTANCANPDPAHAALYAFGRASGLEGTAPDDAIPDVMDYPPDFMPAVYDFAEDCAAIVLQNVVDPDTGEVTPDNALECTSADHAECEAGQQNSHADLLGAYGQRPATPDTEAPVIAITAPAEGEALEGGAEVALAATVEDTTNYIAGKWSLSSPALEAAGVEGGEITYCTNGACDVGCAIGTCNWADASPFKAADSSWGLSLALPPGDYTATFQAADAYANTAEAVTVTFSVMEAASADSTGGGDEGDGDGGQDDGGPLTTGADESGTGDGGGSDDDGGADTETTGCSCTTESSPRGGALFGLLSLIGLGVLRRRRAI